MQVDAQKLLEEGLAAKLIVLNQPDLWDIFFFILSMNWGMSPKDAIQQDSSHCNFQGSVVGLADKYKFQELRVLHQRFQIRPIEGLESVYVEVEAEHLRAFHKLHDVQAHALSEEFPVVEHIIELGVFQNLQQQLAMSQLADQAHQVEPVPVLVKRAGLALHKVAHYRLYQEDLLRNIVCERHELALLRLLLPDRDQLEDERDQLCEKSLDALYRAL